MAFTNIETTKERLTVTTSQPPLTAPPQLTPCLFPLLLPFSHSDHLCSSSMLGTHVRLKFSLNRARKFFLCVKMWNPPPLSSYTHTVV